MKLTISNLRRLIREAVSDVVVTPEQKVALVNEPYDASKLAGVQQSSGQMAFKPRGYWYACGPDWIEFTRREMKEKYYENGYLYQFGFHYTDVNTPDPDKVLAIRNDADYQTFKENYLRTDTFPNWPKIAQDFGGIELCPLPSDYNFWLRTWDVDSGCFWNPAVMESMRVLHEPESASDAMTSIVNSKNSKTYAALPEVLKEIFRAIADDYLDDDPFEIPDDTDQDTVEGEEVDFIFNKNHDPENPDDYTIFDAIEEVFDGRGYDFSLSGDFYEICSNIMDYLDKDVTYYRSGRKLKHSEYLQMKREKSIYLPYLQKEIKYSPTNFEYLRPAEKMQLMTFVIHNADQAPTFNAAGLTLASSLGGNEEKMENGDEILEGVNKLLSDVMRRLGFSESESKVDLDRDSSFTYQMRENEEPTRFF
jgi:hypothetical protein